MVTGSKCTSNASAGGGPSWITALKRTGVLTDVSGKASLLFSPPTRSSEKTLKGLEIRDLLQGLSHSGKLIVEASGPAQFLHGDGVQNETLYLRMAQWLCCVQGLGIQPASA